MRETPLISVKLIYNKVYTKGVHTDLSGNRILWARHATKECIEDNFDQLEIEKALKSSLVVDPGSEKKKAICRLKDHYCTIIFVQFKHGLKIITCWESSNWEISAYERELK